MLLLNLTITWNLTGLIWNHTHSWVLLKEKMMLLIVSQNILTRQVSIGLIQVRKLGRQSLHWLCFVLTLHYNPDTLCLCKCLPKQTCVLSNCGICANGFCTWWSSGTSCKVMIHGTGQVLLGRFFLGEMVWCFYFSSVIFSILAWIDL